MSIIDDILDLSKLEMNSFSLSKQWFDIEECIKDIVSVLEVQSRIKNINILYKIKRGVPIMTFTDEKRLKQILFNLVGNALKFTFKG